MGYDLFDSAMPTRDARHGRLYAFSTDPSVPLTNGGQKWFTYLYINDDKMIKNPAPISLFCDCLCCSNYSIAYLHHLFKIHDGLFMRLATIHNLRFMTQLMERLKVHRHERRRT
jgi:queuine tRNA-ribosyltransferase